MHAAVVCIIGGPCCDRLQQKVLASNAERGRVGGDPANSAPMIAPNIPRDNSNGMFRTGTPRELNLFRPRLPREMPLPGLIGRDTRVPQATSPLQVHTLEPG